MSKFFTYGERLELQKYLKESLSFKETSRRLEKIQLPFLEKSVSIVQKLLQVTMDFHSMLARIALTAETRTSAVKDAPENRLYTVSFVLLAIQTVQILLKFMVPYVCNSCETIGKCTLLKNIYDAEHAHVKAYESILHIQLSLTKIAFQLTKWHLVLLLSLFFLYNYDKR